ncbi:MAG TPA: succinate dehydrogenase cytochrome b subunit [Thermoanaerobaculia bacterium]|jgi:succinate dehydrogenase / fumarate reductase cytochrome b subunit|nr:succinate dehydrogenase cytochrome b subunit [Thermoanaerobaculia bacterium]
MSRAFSMSFAANFYRSAIGKKVVMAVTGVILFGWIFLHMVGNLKLYFGPVHMNEYAHWLRAIGTPAMPETTALWMVRLLLLVCVVLHIHAAYALTMMNRAARPVDYHDREYVAATYAARTMRWGGVIILLFIFYHLAHLTFGGHVAPMQFIKDDPYHNVVAGFQVWWVSAIYIIANLALGLHLYHGVWSMFNSVGLNHPKFNPWRRHFATAFAVLITVVNISFPIAVLMGIVR